MAGITNSDNSDGRKLGEWKSSYESNAVTEINKEAVYLVVIYLIAILFTFIIWGDFPLHWFKLHEEKYTVFKKFSVVYFGGMFGGAIFDFKWLIHAVAKKKWHEDRRLWRVLVPWVSGAFSLAFAALICSGLIKVFDSDSLQTPSAGFGFGFLVGYFSDNAIAKLSEVAQTLFGTLEDKSKKEEKKDTA